MQTEEPHEAIDVRDRRPGAIRRDDWMPHEGRRSAAGANGDGRMRRGARSRPPGYRDGPRDRTGAGPRARRHRREGGAGAPWLPVRLTRSRGTRCRRLQAGRDDGRVPDNQASGIDRGLVAARPRAPPAASLPRSGADRQGARVDARGRTRLRAARRHVDGAGPSHRGCRRLPAHGRSQAVLPVVRARRAPQVDAGGSGRGD